MLDAVAPAGVATTTDSADSLASPRVPCGRNPDAWAVVHSHPQAERWAAQNLVASGYRVFLPLCTVQRRDRAIRSLMHRVQVPLYPRYLFLVLDGPWTPARYSPGVHRLLMTDGRPYVLPEGVCEALQAGEEVRRQPSTSQTLHRPGAACVVRHGVCGGMVGTVTSVQGDMARVSLLMLGEYREIAFPMEMLAPRIL